MIRGIPTEGANAELKDGELGGGVSDFEVAHVGAVKLEGFAPGSAGDAAHLEVDGHEVRRSDVVTELRQRWFEVCGGHRLQRKCQIALRGDGGGGGDGGGSGGGVGGGG